MQIIESTDKTWDEIKTSLTKGHQLTGVCVVRGRSQLLSNDLHDLLEDFACRGQSHAVKYFLCTGNSHFPLACYEPFQAVSPEPHSLDPFHVMNYAGIITPDTKAVYQPHIAVRNLEQEIEKQHASPHLLVIECFNTPPRCDVLFIQSLFMSSLAKRLFILIVLHQQEKSCISDTQTEKYHELLAFLYMCGGRIRQKEWDQLFTYTTIPSVVSIRRVDSTTWFSYRDQTIQQKAADIFASLDTQQKQLYASELLTILPSGTGYPLLSLACYTQNIHTMLSKYSPEALTTALVQPRTVLLFFRQLRRVTKHQGDRALQEAITVNYISSLLYVYRTMPRWIYWLLEKHHFQFTDKKVEARLLFAIGQRFTKGTNQGTWEHASTCFQRGRECLTTIESIDQKELCSRLAAIANGEALVAMKHNQPTRALQLEEEAFAHLQKTRSSIDTIAQQVLIQSHIGDLYLYKFANVEAALLHYKKAHALALTYPAMRAREYIDPKLASALTKSGNDEAAISILEGLCGHFFQLYKTQADVDRNTILKTVLTLAQIYTKNRNKRRAALCYWRILRHPEWLKPATVKGIAENLAHFRPAMPLLLKKRITRIITQQEIAMHNVTQMNNIFTDMANNAMPLPTKI